MELGKCLSTATESYGGLRLRLTHPTQLSRRRYAVIGEVDLEHAGIELLARIQIIDRDRGVVALRIGDGPLLQLAVLGTDHEHEAAGADQRLLLFDRNA